MMDDSIYQQTLDYLYSFVDYSMQRNLRNAAAHFDLARMVTLLEALGHPEGHYPVIHVAGTKGKGSVSALCASALRAAGLHVGFYTSPHLHEYTERIQVDGVPISPEELVGLVEEMKPAIAAIPERTHGQPVTTFEITTALAFLYFSRRKVDIAVIEVGLGGRLDATNVVTPLVSVITSLSYDHMALLGDTLAQIAAEKAGIIKPGIPLVLAPQQEEARQVVARIAAERQAPLIQIGQEYAFEALAHSLEGQTFRLKRAGEPAVELRIPLLGAHQVENACTAYTALQVVRAAGIAVSEDAIREGFERVVWPGRFEVLRRQPPLVVDSAHNRDSARRLRQALDEYFPGRPFVLVFGASEDKDVAGMFAELLPRIRQIVATKSTHPRAMALEQLIELARPFGCPVDTAPDVPEALQQALRLGGSEAGVLVAGSLFIAAAAREAWPALRENYA